jgi:hypothetical protein
LQVSAAKYRASRAMPAVAASQNDLEIDDIDQHATIAA